MDTGKLELQAMQLEILVELMGNDIGLHCTLSTIWSKHGTSLQYSLNVTQSNTICNVVTEADNLVWIGKIGGGVTGYSSITADRGDDKHCEKEDQCEKVESCETEELDEKDEQCEKKERCEKEEQCEKEKEKEKQG